ncbi:hypothetical protein KFK09_000498 [Dendrobium nobile]|uniref:Uncharacterized protein n=1 Tax=Dendrobium nobile TaxID=94219 RepID=A0A8T3CE47_DENNO|nr:hypothetical protein KFK09_000498 [Dendrobium nobile]
MASGDDPPRKSFASKFRRKKITASRPTQVEVGEGLSVPPDLPTPPPPPTMSQQHSPEQGQGHSDPPPVLPPFFPVLTSPSPDQTHASPFYPYYPPPSSQAAGPSTGPHPPYPYPYYYPYPVQHEQGGPSRPPEVGASPPAAATDKHQYIEPDGDNFNPSRPPIHMIRDIIKNKYDAPYLSWKKIPKPVRDMWFGEFQKQSLGREPTPLELHTRTHQHQADHQWVDEKSKKAHSTGEGSSSGSTYIFEYHTWSEVVGGRQRGRVYGMGSQAFAIEGSSSTSAFHDPSGAEESVSEMVAALTREIEEMRRVQNEMQAELKSYRAEN